jgi:hypothetical protein
VGATRGAHDHGSLNRSPNTGGRASLVPAQMPSDDEVQFVLGDGQVRQAVVAVVTPYKPDERSVWRRHSGVVPNAAIAAVELYDGEVCVCRSGSREAERQRADCEEEFLHSP